MKRTTWLTALAAMMALLATGCDNGSNEPEPVAVESVTLNVTTLALAPGAKEKVTATVLPENADDKTVVWSSSDLAVATVGEDGTVTARAEGTATITAHAGGKTATCAVTVNKITEKPEPVAVESVTLNATTLTLEPGKTMTLTATVLPESTDDRTVMWSSSDTAVATVGEDGTVTAVKAGEATITARAGGKTAVCEVTVKPILIAVESVTLNETTLTLMRGTTGNLTATVLPENADDKTVLWSSSNASVATVGNDGTVTAVKVGEAKITAQAGEMTAECTITVNPIPVGSITLNTATLTLAPNMTEKLTATVLPDDADDKTVTWASSDASVATVGEDGTVTTHKVGEATITAQAGGKEATCEVTVHAHKIQGGKNTCTKCGIVLEDFEINESNRLTKYKGSAATVDIPDGVTAIGYYAFSGCTSLTSVTIPEGVKSIGGDAFNGCTSLASVTIPDSVTEIGHYAFYECTSLASVDIPDGVKSIGEYAFYDCTSLASVTIPEGVKSIGSGAFEGCTSLASVEITEGVTEIGQSAFYGCTSLTTINYTGTEEQWKAIVKNKDWDADAGKYTITYNYTE